MLKIMERAIKEIVSAEIDRSLVLIKRQWDVKIYSIGENDIVVFPAEMTSADFDKISKSLVDAGVRGVITANDIRVIRLS